MTLTLLFSLVLGLSLKQQSVAGVLEDGSNGGPCLPNAICTDSNAECLNNICNCIQGFVDVAGTCRMQGKIGGPCLPDANCTDENAVCSQNNVCTCIQDYVDVNGTCRLPDYTSTTSTTSTTSVVAQDETTNLPMTTATTSSPVEDYTNTTTTTSTTSVVAQDETTNPPMTSASTSSPAEGTPTPDPTGNCDTECLNGGSCVSDEKTANFWCDCAVGFTGLNCETEVDFCAATPCPVGATCQPDYSNDQGFVCICQGDFKGPDCTEEDNLVVCQDFEETLYLDLQPTAEDRKICLPKKKSVQGDICFDATEDLVYTAHGIDDTLIRIADEPDQYCLEYYSDDPIAPKYCMTVTASEADDIQLRPWRKANATICFLFNRKPEFWAPTDVAYNLPDMAETEILDLSVSDPDSHQQLNFQIIAVSPQQYLDLFTVKTPGAIEVTKASTIHTDPLNINVSLKIEDNGIPALSIEKILKVKFTDRQLLCVVTEDPIYIHFPAATRLPLQIGQINCAAQNTSVTFSLQGDGDVSSAFSVDDSGLLYLNQNLGPGNYQVNVRAQIDHPITVVSQVSVKVVIGNMLPDCSVALLPFSVKENMPAGACSNTTYSCLNPSGKPVGCSDDGLELFEMQCLPAEGKNILFRFCAMTSLQGKVGYYLLNVTLSNQYGESALDIEAIIENVNDRPIIDKTIKYAFNVEENLQVGESLATITVTDPDLLVDINPPENLTVEITAPLNTDESTQMYPFEVSLSQNQDYIELILSDPLDVKVTQNYVFNIQVSDLGGLSDNVLVTVIVEDVNEPPSCQQYSYDGITVSVKDKRDKMVVTLACSDDDLIPEFKNLFYEIQGDQVVKDHFSVDVNGVVTLIRPLTDIDESILNFTVVISDGVGSSVTVNITVIVSSDFPPECGDDVIPTSKSENMGETVCFTVNTGCVEPVNSLPLRYEIDSGNGTQLFKLNDEQTPNGISLCSKIKLKNKYGTWVLTGRAVSDFGATPITISISVTDINDPPTFELSLYEASVEENSKIGSAVIQVRATDPDSGAFGQVTYVSQGIESSEMFSLNPNDGWITVSGTVDADVPGPSEYRFIVEALNGGQPHNQPINATVLISVTDTNDNAPECQEPPASIPLYLLTPVDAIVYNLICSDTDKSPEYRQLRYKLSDITSQSGSETFAVDSNGVIRLVKALSRTIQRYRIAIVVQDSDDPVTALQANVDLDFAVNTTVPPRCTPAMINDTLPETKPKNFCLNNQVECIDITEGDRIGMGQPVGNGTKFLDIRTRTDKNKLFLSACVMNPIKDQFGTYQVEAAVSNGLAETEVIWTFTVTNVNEPPRFSFELYEASIKETFSPGKIISLTVTDPDENTPEKIFHIAKVEAKLQNNEEFDGALTDSITFFEVSRDFYVVVKNLNATERNQYIYLVTATDGKGLIATCTVVINITDVNEEPICTTSTIFEEIDILVPVGETISGVECFDNDLDTRNTELQYRITKGDPDGYFNMTLDGLITVAKPLPRTLLYNTGTASLEIVVEDRGIPPLSTTVTASINVDIRIKPVCNPVITPPDRWYQGECLTVTMDCKDPTMPGSFGHLVFTLEGNYTSGFTDLQNIAAVFSLCYKLAESGVFEIVVRVDNDLSPFIFKEVVEVKYLQATPVFTSPSFTVAVSEFTKENQDILTANATSSELIGELLYNVIATESTPRWSVYFSLDSKNGKITTRKELKELANTIMYLKLQVEDTGSKLKSSALAEISIEDENEAPSCTIADTDVNIDVDTDVEESIISFNCSDPDVVANYKALSYSLTGSTNVNIYFKMMPETNPTSVVVKTPLSVTASSYDSRVDNSKSAYHVTIVVSDGGEPAKVYRKPFKIIVSLLPPAVTWSILELGYSHVFVTWEYDRSEYYQVTTAFQVKVKKPNIDDFVGTEEVKPDRRIYNTTGLEPNTTYEIFVSAITQYGTRDPPAQTIITAEIPRISIITATIKYAALSYDEQLRNSETDLYAETTKRVITSIEFVLKDLPGYVGVEVKSYRPGSLIVTTIISVNQSGNVENTKQLLADSVSSGYLGQLAVDKAYFVANIGGGYVLVDKIEISSDDLYNGTDISISCFVTTAGYELSEKFHFWWTYNGNIIRPNSASRISTVSFSGAKFPELYMSIIEIKRASPKDSGTYACYVTDSEETSSSNKDINIDVLSQPIVTLTPRSLTVRSGTAVSIVCTLIEPLDKKETFQFQWYRNGSDLELQQGEEYNETTGTLTISSMTVTTIIGCRGRNEAGEGPLVQSHIGVIPTGPTVIICSETRDNRGTVWSEAVPGTVAIAPCPEGYKGEATRVCGADGKWKPPVYSCVQISVIGIQEQLRGLTDGSGTTQITDSLKGLDNATDDEILFEGDLKAVVDTLEDAVIASNNTIKPDTETEHHDEMNNYLKVCSNALDERNQESWDVTIELEDYGANEVTFVVEKYLKIKSNQLSDQLSAPFEKVFEQKNIFAEVGRKSGKAITFPDKAKPVPGWIEGSGSSIYVPEQSLKDLPVVLYDGTYYRDLYTKVVRKLVQNGQIEDFAETLEFNAAIIGCNVQGLSAELDPPVVINFKLNNTNSSNPVCVFWDHQTKVWSKEGCFLDDFSREDEVTCKCNHLTNFAVLMSPGKAVSEQSPADILALSIISAVGCAISMFCLLVTVVIHLSLWRIVKSDRAIILLNLCIALLIGYALFLGGVSQAAEKDLCTAVAILLHYIFLVVFFLMLAEGIDIGVSIVYVFATKSRIKWLLPLAWLIPAVIVAISLGVTKTEGYGNETFCWLSIESGLIYAFVGPAAFVILFNFIIIIIVFRKMFTSSAMLTKSDKEKAKTSLRSLCVLLPILGLTWVFGVFSVNKDLVAFQYIFAICNSLQGFFIFLFHCFLNKQLRDALTLRRARKKSLQSFEKSYKNQHSTGTGSTTYHSSVDNTKGINNDLEPAIKSSSSNPFLEADRQMKELVSKGKKTGNTFDKDADTKNKVDKDKPPVDVALEDVKISNILRESEVMGGTAGISSILTTQPNAERTQRDDERQEDDKKNLRESKASSHAYDYALEPAYRTDGGQAKPAGYEKLLPQQSRSTGYDRIVRSDDNMTGLYYGVKDSGSRGRGMTDSRERIDEGREQRSTSSGRSDEDYEERLRERQQRLNTVYMPYERSANVPHDVGASLPKKYDPKQAKKVEPPKKGVVSGKPKIAEGGAVKKLSSKKKKEMERDRSRLYQYQYPYDSAYLGQQSRHSSLENMSTHYVNPEYNPYAGMHPQGYTGRPTHQHQHQHQHQQWNPYGWGNQQRRDYW